MQSSISSSETPTRQGSHAAWVKPATTGFPCMTMAAHSQPCLQLEGCFLDEGKTPAEAGRDEAWRKPR